MSYTPLARWRNFTLENLKAILDVFPDMSGHISRDSALDMIEQELSGYKKTAYQFACQLGLECRQNVFKVQNYLYSFDDDNLNKYLDFWFKMYVTPNPFVHSTEQPICIFKELADEILSSDEKKISYSNFCQNHFGDGKSSDILLNAITCWAKPICVAGDNIFINQNDIDDLNRIVEKVNMTLPMQNNKSELEFFNRFTYDKFCKFYDIEDKIIDEVKDNNDNSSDKNTLRVTGGTNILLYGVPGSGKSYTIENIYCKDIPNERKIRVVFHPDYTYSDFIGQILPVTEDKKLSYEFTPGPFTEILKNATDGFENKYCLIIEEINRGNAPAIFGEVFQLLDRDNKGTSVYDITNTEIAKYVYNDENHKVLLPSNMYIIATMNTSDQNVFTLDTAFQRRWDMRMIKNDFDKLDNTFANHKIWDTDITWKQFATIINEIILAKNKSLMSSEDKRLGTYFIKLKDLECDTTEDDLVNSHFPEKVFKYLWDDALKFYREDVFNTDKYLSLDQIIDKFRYSIGNERFDMFKDNMFASIIDGQTESDE